MKYCFWLVILIPFFASAQREKFKAISGGLARYGDHSGFHAELASGLQLTNVDLGTYTSLIKVSDQNFLRWTILGLQLRGGPLDKAMNPYVIINYGLLNMGLNQPSGNSINLRNATLDLGAGISVPLFGNFSFIADFRWKRYFDWKDEIPPFSIWTINGGVKF